MIWGGGGGIMYIMYYLVRGTTFCKQARHAPPPLPPSLPPYGHVHRMLLQGMCHDQGSFKGHQSLSVLGVLPG